MKAASTLNNEKAEELSHNGLDLWVEPQTGDIAEWTVIDNSKQETFDYLNSTIKQGEIYEFAKYPQLETGNLSTVEGHVFVIEKGNDNQLKIYDPQKRDVYITNEESKMYINSWVDAKEMAKDVMPRTIRIDNKQINPYYEGVLVH